MVATTDQKAKIRALALCDSVKDLLENDARDHVRVATVLQAVKDGNTRFLVHNGPLREKKIPFKNCSPNDQWERVYKSVCGKQVDCAGIVMPPKPDFACWPIIVTPEVPLNAMFAGMKTKFSCWSYCGDDVEKAVDWAKEERDGRTDPYGIWVRAVRDAVEEMNSLSAATIKSRGLKTITLNERIRLEAFYWVLTGGAKRGTHLDVIGWNICPGSRNPDGYVPCVDWRGGAVHVRWASRGGAGPDCGARQVVTL